MTNNHFNTNRSIQDKYTLSSEHQRIVSDVLSRHLQRFNRVTVMRFDLRFPEYLQWDDTKVISRFIDAFKSRLSAWNNRRESGHPIGFGYIWCREQAVGTSHWHYHVAFMFNKDALFTFGRTEPGADNTYNRIVGAWASALDIDIGEAIGLVHVCANGVYWLDQNAPDYGQTLIDCQYRLSYLTKKETKEIGDGNRHFNASQKIFLG
ncbi:inovirus Gp2 family protein [Shewanella sp. AS1]|uniref:inovirus Gp2 family protein n=1 Tax=Shewanella sp. AS1 TaxID=2907626 RepID=UPI001F37A652|nr:inovirus Gp2 family protein [Shewanella sp. AS1]MCE9679191.1 inovirus Gp2 family protein [Shewanella sp. AS1]